jgi:hypothetical protein
MILQGKVLKNLKKHLMPDVILSASKIKQAQSCSWKYWCSYQLKLPQKGNDGSSRGTVCHNIYELLGQKKHFEKYKSVINSGSIFSDKGLSRLTESYAKKLSVNDDENMNLIDQMTMRGLSYDFFGNEDVKADDCISEKAFNINIDEEGKKYRIRGFIDKLFLYCGGEKALIRDFKTSKQLFKGKEITDNLQNLMYTLAVKKLFPKCSDIRVEFLFVKFDLEKDLLGSPGKGVMEMKPISQDELEGFEYQLTSIQEYLENFDEKEAKGYFAADQNYPSDNTFGGPLMCGKDGYKKRKGEYLLDENGEKILNYICEFRNPFDYYAVINSSGELISCYFTEEEIKLKEGESIEKRKYQGCPHFHNEFSDVFV